MLLIKLVLGDKDDFFQNLEPEKQEELSFIKNYSFSKKSTSIKLYLLYILMISPVER